MSRTDDLDAQVTAILQDGCADGHHIYTRWHDGLSRCSCGKAHPEHLALALRTTTDP